MSLSSPSFSVTSRSPGFTSIAFFFGAFWAAMLTAVGIHPGRRGPDLAVSDSSCRCSGLFLIYAACRLARHSSQQIDPRRNLVFRLARRWLPLARTVRSQREGPPAGELRRPLPRAARRDDWRIAPPLLVLLVVESTDVLFAVDSIPAIFGITRDPLIIFTSNIFAILGLRALYFLLAGVMDLFRYLHYGLAAVLAFVGLKMVAEGWLPHEAGTEIVPVWASLAVIAALLGVAILASLLAGKREELRFEI